MRQFSPDCNYYRGFGPFSTRRQCSCDHNSVRARTFPFVVVPQAGHAELPWRSARVPCPRRLLLTLPICFGVRLCSTRRSSASTHCKDDCLGSPSQSRCALHRHGLDLRLPSTCGSRAADIAGNRRCLKYCSYSDLPHGVDASISGSQAGQNLCTTAVVWAARAHRPASRTRISTPAAVATSTRPIPGAIAFASS